MNKLFVFLLSITLSFSVQASSVFDLAKKSNIPHKKVLKYVQNKLPTYANNQQVNVCSDVYNKDPESVTYALFNIIIFFEMLNSSDNNEIDSLKRKKYLAQQTSISLKYCANL